MAKSKRAPALFEVIESRQLQGSSSKLVLPKWWRSSKGANPNYPPVEPPEQKPAEQGKIIKLTPTFAKAASQESAPVSAPPKPAPAVTASAPSESSAGPVLTNGPRQSSPPVEPGGRPPAVQTRGGRIQLSLNPINAAIVIGVVVAAVLASYKLGGQFKSSGSMQDDLAKAFQEKPRPEVLPPSSAELSASRRSESGRRETRSEPPSASRDRQASRAGVSGNPPAPSPGTGSRTVSSGAPKQAEPTPEAAALPEVTAARKVGLNYLYLPLMRTEHRDQALRGQQWLMSKGLAFTVEEEGGRPQLVSVEGFDYTNSADRAKAEELRSKVKNLAAAFRKELKSDYDISSTQMKKLRN